METKICGSCGLEKEVNKDNFYWRKDSNKWENRCINCILIKNEEYRQKNKDKISAKQKERYEDKKEEILAKILTYYILNKDKITKYRNEYKNNRMKTDPNFKLHRNISRGILKSLQFFGGKKFGKSILIYLFYTIEELRLYLESLWEPWMNWDNHGVYKIGGPRKWHIDHIIPQSQLPYTEMSHDPESNFQKCWALSNLRPLEAVRNMSDGARKTK